jgi:serine/threonine-protein kinase OSR1/STK39
MSARHPIAHQTAPSSSSLAVAKMPLSGFGVANAWPCFANEYDHIARIEQGQFSEVWSGNCKLMKQKVCIKIMDLEKISTSFEDILQEVQTMRLSDDPNILNCYCSFVHKDQLWLISQFMNKGSCLRVMSIAKQLNLGEGLEEESIGYILSEALKGLNYLHQRGCVHRDVKCGNILLDDSGSVRLSDFGVNRWTMTSSATAGHTLNTSLSHAAPETLEGDSFDSRIDIWSLGITALELANGCPPYADQTPAKTIKLILEDEPPSLKSYPHDKQLNFAASSFSKFFEDFYKRCLQKNPKLRPSSVELSKHKFLRNRNPTTLISFLSNIYDVDSSLPGNMEDQSIDNTMSDFQELADESPTSCIAIDEARCTDLMVEEPNQKLLNTKIEQSFVPGTSWVFDVEESIRGRVCGENNSLSKSGINATGDADSIKDFLEDFDQNDASM